MTSITTEIYLVRHAETTSAHSGQYIGSTDVAISEHGAQQADLLAERLQAIHFDACYCSIMRRCQETARIVAAAHQLDIQIVENLREIDYGAWEGLTTAEMQTQNPGIYADWLADPAVIRAPGGESAADVLQRVQSEFERIAAAHSGQRILIVAHKSVNRIWLCQILGYPISSYRQAVKQDFTTVNILEYVSDSESGAHHEHRFSIKLLNDSSHIKI